MTGSPESAAGPQVLDFTPEFLEQILEEPLFLGAPETVEDYAAQHQYNEREQIAVDANDALLEVRDQARRVAEATGPQVTPEQLAAWRPTHADSELLRNKKLYRQRRNLTIMRGVEEYLDALENQSHRHGVPMRAHQKVVAGKFCDFLLHKMRTTPQGGKSGLIEMPTGTGKTGIFANIAAAVKYGEDPQKPVRVLVLVPTNVVLGQTIGEGGKRGFGKFAPHLNHKIGVVNEDSKEIDQEIVVTTTASFHERQKRGLMPDFDVVIVDEAHTVVGDKIGKSVQDYCADKIAIGLTATPEYDENHTAHQLFEHTIHKMELPEGMDARLLAPARAWVRRVVPNINYKTLPTNETARQRLIREAYLRAWKNDAIDLIKEELNRGVGVIVRCPAYNDVDHARTFAKELQNTLTKDLEDPSPLAMRWIRAAFVGGKKQSKNKRFEIIEYFDEATQDVLTYVKGIGMGWDSPHAKVLINLAPTESKVEMIQAVGRVLRRIRGGDNKAIIAHIYDYEAPWLRGKQYTGVMAIKAEPGRLRGHEDDDESEEVPAPPPRRRRQWGGRGEAEVVGHTVDVIAYTAVGHATEPEGMTDAERLAGAATVDANEPLSRDEACRILGISPPTLDSVLLGVEINPRTADLHYGDLRTILEAFPRLEAQLLPDMGYKSMVDITPLLPAGVRAFQFIRFGRSLGVHPARFTAPDGKVRFYYTDAEVEMLLEWGRTFGFKEVIKANR